MNNANDTYRVMVVDDEEALLHFLIQAIKKRGYQVEGVSEAAIALQRVKEFKPHLVISDIRMPDISGLELLKQIKAWDQEVNVVLITAHATIESAVSAIRDGAADYLLKPFKVQELYGAITKAVSTKRLFFKQPNGSQNYEEKYDLTNLIGGCTALKKINKLIKTVADTDSTVLITGESGTGKEMVARSVHYYSQRREAPFVSINCAALPDTLLESELFGYEKGAFTGAVGSKQGLIELANGGTLLLDEIGEIPPHIQAKLLRVIQEKEIRHVGGLRDIPVDVRILAATNRDLKQETIEGGFREDLYYRLNVVPIALPPLRERAGDIELLLQYFLAQFGLKYGKPAMLLEEDAFSYLTQEYHWPGNIRELENLAERMTMLTDGASVAREQLNGWLEVRNGHKPNGSSGSPEVKDLKIATEEFERRLITAALAESRGNKFQAAKSLNISRQSLQYKLRKYLIE